MTLLVLMYHKISEITDPSRIPRFQRHLSQLAAKYPIMTPGESVPQGRLGLCLSFDDAYYDFYQHVFPLLKNLNIKAVLGIPTAFIQDSSSVAPERRLRVPYPDGLSLDPKVQAQVPLCTWAELREMTQSGHVYPASHSHTHANLGLNPENPGSPNWDQEICHSQTRLQDRLGVSIDTFVYPYGRLSPEAHRRVRAHYRFGMRIGSALNRGWSHPEGLIYRLDADPLWLQGKSIGPGLCALAYLKFLWNRLRGK